MNSVGTLGGQTIKSTHQPEPGNEIEAQVLRSRLVNLTLHWELAALRLDAQRYRADAAIERESLRDRATAYRKCITALTEVLAGSSLLAYKT
jgi:hypothetical protein